MVSQPEDDSSSDFSGQGLTVFPDLSGLVIQQTTKLVLAGNQFEHLPPQIGQLTSLQDLDVSRTGLKTVPEEIGQLVQLKFLNLMCNELSTLPDSIGCLTELYRLGLKSNKLTVLPDSIGNMAGLVEVFLTDNRLKSLPESLGRCSKLVKLQAARNELESVPESVGLLPCLELMRVAVNNIASVPDTYLDSPRLAWFSLAGNPACPPAPEPSRVVPVIPFSDLTLGVKLGDGASGDVYQVEWQGKQYAFKQFKADDASPDGQASDEIAVKVFVQHHSLTDVVARVLEPNGVVMHLVHGRPMAQKPNFESLLRCRWGDATFTVKCAPLNVASTRAEQLAQLWALQAIADTASALLYLHENNIMHGDVYAHNMLADADGKTVLCDYGAAFFYPAEQQQIWEAMEVLAWGRFLKDVLARLQPVASDAERACVDAMTDLCDLCLSDSIMVRPFFDEITDALAPHCAALGVDLAPCAPDDPHRPSLTVVGRHWDGDGIASDVGLPNVDDVVVGRASQ